MTPHPEDTPEREAFDREVGCKIDDAATRGIAWMAWQAARALPVAQEASDLAEQCKDLADEMAWAHGDHRVQCHQRNRDSAEQTCNASNEKRREFRAVVDRLAALAAPQPSQGAEVHMCGETSGLAFGKKADCSYCATSHHPADEASMLRELLARIHGDGGHYIAQHGLEKAVEDADLIVSDLLALQPASAEAGKGVDLKLAEDLAKLGWQTVVCDLCGQTARGFPSESVAVSGDVSEDAILEAAEKVGLAKILNPIGMQTGKVAAIGSTYMTEEILAFADAVLALAKTVK